MTIFDGNHSKPPTPIWLKWAMLVFLALATLNIWRAEKGDGHADLKVENYPEVEDFISEDRWRRIMNPHYDKETIEEPEPYGPDFKPPESDQTLSDDGGNGESR